MSDRIDELVEMKRMVLDFDPERLRRCRVGLRVTMTELAHALHVNPRTVSAWETGQYPPSEQHVIELEHFMQRAEEAGQ